MSCPACGRDNRPGARFCLDCGAALAARCTACGAELPAGARFCDGCGTPVTVASSGAQTRRVVTVVFADLAGSTRLQETLDPESVRRLMDRFNDAMRAAVERHAGTVVKFTGDGLMAAFGVRDVAEDDAWRSVQAAVAMQEAFATLEWNADVALRVGVNTGEVIVTEGESDVVGDAVNVAARLEAAASPGGVLVGEQTWRLTRHLARFEAVAPLTLKGKAEPVPAYQLVALGEDVSDAAAPFVGRGAELARLLSAFDVVGNEGRVQLATVIGSPGLGKSRLAAEFVAGLAGRATVLEARFSATTAVATFAPVVDALREAVGDDAVGDVVSASPQEVFLAVRRALEGLAAERPVVLVLEDLHWAEPLALDLVEHLVEWTQDTPLLLLALARPELREKRSALVETTGRASLVTVLEGLDPADSERLACDLLETDELPPALLSRILAGSEGNPLFVRELVRMLVDDGVLRRHEGRWRPTIEVDAITVPPTIQSLLAARVERLPADERTVLECAAVVGREFYRGAVAELLPPTMRLALDVVLERLRQKEMVEPEGTYWIDEPVLRFHHVLLRDAAYRRLLKEVRAELHERYARWLEAKAGDADDNDEVLGYHLEQAHRYRIELGLFDEHTAVLGHRAAERLATAGRRALDRDDLPAAAGLLGRALAGMDGDDPDRPGLLIDRCEALVTTGALSDGSLAIAELEGLAAGSPRLRAWASCFAAQLAILTDPGQLQETAAVVERAAAELAKLADAAGAAKAHAVHASALARLGRVAETEAALDRALAAAREAGDTRRATAVLAGAPLAALWGPSPVARASGRCLDVVRVLRITTSATTVEATSLRCQAVLEALRGRTDAARRMLASARRSLEELGHRHGLLSTDMFAGLVELLADDPVAAERALQRAHDGFLELGAGADAGQAAALLGRALLAQGRSAEAEELTVESERLGGADLKTAIAWRAVRAEALARRGSVAEALELASAAVALAEPTDALLDQADTHLAMATVLQLAGRADEAGASAARAVELYERKGATVPAERARNLMAAPSTTAPEPAAGTVSRRRFTPNAATAACERAVLTLNDGHMPAYQALFAPDAAMVDHVHSTDGNAYSMTAGWASFESTADAAIAIEPLQSLGGRHALVRCTMRFEGPSTGPAEVVDLRAMRVGADGRIRWQERFRTDQLHLALARLLELHADDEMEGADRSASLGLAEVCRRSSPEGWDQMLAESFAEDVVLVDHRTVVNFGVRNGRDDVLAAFAEMREVAGPTDPRLVDILAATPTGGLLEIAVDSRPPGAFQFQFLVISIVGPDGLVRHGEWFELGQLDAAHARFEELVGSAPLGDRVLENAATQTNERFWRAVVDNDWGVLETTAAPDVCVESRRPGLRFELVGLDDYLANLRVMAQAGWTLVQHSVVATRGERLALIVEVLGSGSSEVEIVLLVEVDDDGRRRWVCTFDPNQLPEALEALDERFAASGIDTGAWALANRFRDAYRSRDWDAFAATLHPSFHIVDHRPAGWGTVGAGEFQELSLSLLRIASDTRMDLWAIPVVTPRGMAVGVTMAGTTEDGAPFEIPRAMVVLIRDAAIERFELFPPDQLDAAVARLRELTAGSAVTGEPRPTAATRAMEELIRLVLGRDWEGVRARIAPDVEWTDRRVAVGIHVTDPETYLENLRAIVSVGVTAMDTTLLATRGEEHQLARIVFRGETRDGDPGEVAILQVNGFASDGKIRYSSDFELDDRAAAFAHLDERFALSLSDEEAAAFSLGTRLVRSYNDRAWDEHFGLLADDFRSVDHRLAGQPPVGRDDFERLVRGLVDVADDARIEILEVPLVTADGIVAITVLRATGEHAGPSEVHRTQMVLVRDGFITHFENWAVEDVDAAVASLRKAGASRSSALDVMAEYRRAYKTRDIDGLRALFRADATIIDHRPLGWGNVDRDAFLDLLRSLFAVSSDTEIVTTSVVRVAHQGVLSTSHSAGHADTGGAFELAVHLLVLVEDGVITHYEMYPPDANSAAEARFDELTKRSDALGIAPNTASRLVDRFNELFAAREWDRLSELVSDDFVIEDRRPATQNVIRGRDAFVENNRLMEAVTQRLMTLVATRGEHLTLVRSVWQGGELGEQGPFEVETLDLCEIDDRGLGVSFVTFDPADLNDALAELDARFRARATAAAQEALRIGDSFQEAFEARDWSRFERVLAPDMVVVDHRDLGFRPRTRDDYLSTTRALLELAPDMRSRNLCQPRATAHGAVALWNFFGTYGDGAPFERPFVLLTLMRAGLIHHIETFPPEDLDAAVERFDELTASPVSQLWNRACDQAEAVAQRLLAQDWDGLAGLLAVDAVAEDRRPGLGHVVRGRDAMVESYRSMVGVREADRGVIATRGERLVLVRVAWRGEVRGSAFEVENVAIFEVDTSSAITAIVSFGPLDLDAAFEELDRRFARGEAAACEDPLQTMEAFLSAHAAQDWHGVADVLHPDLEVIDHRHTGWWSRDKQAYLESIRQFAEQASTDHARVIAILRIAPWGSAHLISQQGTYGDGTRYERLFAAVIAVIDGRTQRIEYFNGEDLDRAVARFDELDTPVTSSSHDAVGVQRSPSAADESAEPVAFDPIENAASRLGRRIVDRIVHHDVAGYLALHEPDIVQEDRRAGFRSVLRGRDGHADQIRAMAAVQDAVVTVLGTRGDRHALIRALWSGEDQHGSGFEIETLQVADVSSAGRLARGYLFGPDDVDAAFDELDRCFLQGLDPDAAASWQAAEGLAAYGARDWSGVAATVATDVVAVDHRLGRPTVMARSRDELIDRLRSIAGDVAGETVRRVAVPRATGRGNVSLISQSGSYGDDVVFERRFAAVAMVEEGAVHAVEYFEDDQLGAAIARFDELTGARHPLENQATRLGRRIADSILAHDEDGYVGFFDPEVVQEDRRSGMRNVVRGLEEQRKQIRAMAAVDGVVITIEGTRGQRTALFTQLWTGEDRHGSRFEVETLQLLHFSPAGLLVEHYVFDAGDLGAGFAQLDELFARDEAADALNAWKVLQDVVHSHDQDDPELFSAQARDVQTVIDHRQLGWGELQGGQFRRAAGALVDQSAMRCLAVPRIAPNGLVAVLGTSGTAPFGGGPWENDFVVVARIDGTTASHLEFFAPDQLDTAIVRFEELTS